MSTVSASLHERHERRVIGGKGPRWVLGPAVALVVSVVSAAPAAAVPPANDDIANAVAVSGPGFSATADTRDATFVAGDPWCGAATVWYTFTPASDGRILIDTVGSNYDTMLAVLKGSPGNLDMIACDDNTASDNERMVLDATAGTTYFIQAGSYVDEPMAGQVGPGGDLTLRVSVAPPPLMVNASIARRGVATRLGAARVRGTIVCRPNAEYAGVSVSIRQRQGNRVVAASGWAEVSCTTRRRAWSVTLENEFYAFKRKRAQVRVQASACDGLTCDDVSRQRIVRLRAR